MCELLGWFEVSRFFLKFILLSTLLTIFCKHGSVIPCLIFTYLIWFDESRCDVGTEQRKAFQEMIFSPFPPPWYIIRLTKICISSQQLLCPKEGTGWFQRLPLWGRDSHSCLLSCPIRSQDSLGNGEIRVLGDVQSHNQSEGRLRQDSQQRKVRQQSRKKAEF